jgi:hypothetical protein
LIKPFYDGHS